MLHRICVRRLAQAGNGIIPTFLAAEAPVTRPSRRTLMKIAGSGIAAGAIAKLTPGPAAAQPVVAKPWSAEYWAKKGEVSLYLFRKRLGAPANDAQRHPRFDDRPPQR